MLLQELKNRLTLFKVPGEGEKVIVDEDLFRLILGRALAAVEVDEGWYLSQYADVKTAISNGQTPSAKDHFINHGYLEGRLPRKIVVDETYYLEQNPDVSRAVSEGKVASAQEHFDTRGSIEGRHPYSNFSFFTTDGKVDYAKDRAMALG